MTKKNIRHGRGLGLRAWPWQQYDDIHLKLSLSWASSTDSIVVDVVSHAVVVRKYSKHTEELDRKALFDGLYNYDFLLIIRSNHALVLLCDKKGQPACKNKKLSRQWHRSRRPVLLEGFEGNLGDITVVNDSTRQILFVLLWVVCVCAENRLCLG